MQPKLFVLSGISGSGKSTKAKQISELNDSAIIIETDAIRAELTGDAANQSVNALVFTTAKQRVRNNLKAGKNVIIDATSLTVRDRADFVNIGKECGADCIAVVFPIDRERALRQNKLRTRQVPDWVIEKQAAKFVTPTRREGFSDIQTVKF